MSAARRRQFGSIRQERSGRYRVRYVGPDGVAQSGGQTFRTKVEAGRWLDRLRVQIDSGAWLSPAAGEVTVEDYVVAWIVNRSVNGRPLAERTRDTYRNSLRLHIEPALGRLHLSSLTPQVVRTWHAGLISAGVGPTAIRQAYALLHAVMATAVADDVVLRNPCRVVGAGVARAREQPLLLTIGDVDRLVGFMPGHLAALTVVTFWGALRLGEGIALRRVDLDLAVGSVNVQIQDVETDSGLLEGPPKASSARLVHLPDEATAVLRAHVHSQPPGLPTARLFTLPDGQRLRAHHVHYAWHKARLMSGLPQARWHDLRHASLTLSAQSGATLGDLKLRAGHSTDRAALMYQRSSEARDALVAQRMSDVARRRG